MMQRVERTFAGRKLVIETGRMAKQAAGSALVQYGDTMVLAAVTVSESQSPLPFFPLTVEYKEKTYAAGKIPGGFIKREGRPPDAELLPARTLARSPPTPARGGEQGEDLRRRQDPRWLHQARGATAGRRDPLGPHHRPLHPSPLP